jgi:hypothetical protein
MGNKKYRLAAVKEAPVYHPTAEEFADPLRYIASIRVEAEEFGFCRIVPPTSHWRVPFNQDPATFSFKTRVQTVNELQLRLKKGKNRNFRTEYADFMQSEGQSVTRWPVFGGKKLDLQALYDNVTSRGGFDTACRSKQWRDIARVLDTPATVTSASFALRQLYQKWLLAFETHKRLQEPLSPAGKAKEAAASKKERESRDRDAREREKSEAAAARDKAAAAEKQASVKEEDLLEALFELGNVAEPTPKRLKLEMVRRAQPPSCITLFSFHGIPRSFFFPRFRAPRPAGRRLGCALFGAAKPIRFPAHRCHFTSARLVLSSLCRPSRPFFCRSLHPLVLFDKLLPSLPLSIFFFTHSCATRAGSGGGGAAAGGEAPGGDRSGVSQLRRV